MCLKKWPNHQCFGKACGRLHFCSGLQTKSSCEHVSHLVACRIFTRSDLFLMFQLEGVQQYGPMWKASFGPILTVHVADPELIQQVLRQEGQHPMRSDLSSWKDYRKLRGHHCGLLTSWVLQNHLHVCVILHKKYGASCVWSTVYDKLQ